MSAPRLSVVVPVHNEAQVLKELVERCAKSAESAFGGSFELIIVDDASDDRTPATLRELSNPRLRVLRLEHNAGQYRATRAGLRVAAGEWIAVLDGDLQDPPELIPELLAAARQGGPCVFAVKTGRAERVWFRLGQFCFHLVQSALGSAPAPRGSGSFCVMSRSVAENVAAVDLRHANLAAVAARVLKKMSARHSAVPYEKGSRYDGRSRVGAWGLVREALGSFFVSGALWRSLAVLSGFSLIAAAVLSPGGAGPLFFAFTGLGVLSGVSAALLGFWVRLRFSGVPAKGEEP
jgi:glycosyltransferase involved in cell wall biosynthesis